MVLEAVFYDISSSDDEEEDRNRGGNGFAGSTGLSPNLSEVFNMDAEEDDVVIIDKPTVTGNLKRDKARPIRPISVMDDDECCMLDSDPGATEVTDIVPPLDSDELVMTGEKGPVACRDFPHARYLCVHYPFKTTSHAKFCAQCHCYVCDSIAPCTQWGDGSSANDHCHASEESRWKTLRKLAKFGPVPSRAIPTTVTSPMKAASVTSPTAISLSNLNMNGNATGACRFPFAGVLLDTSSTSPIDHSPISQSPAGHPVGAGAPRQVQGISATSKKDPLVINLKTKARGKPSQPPHLGVRSPRPYPGKRSALPLPRTTSAPSGRIGDEILPPGVQPPQPPQPPQFASYPNPGLGRAGSRTVVSMPHSVPAFTTVPRSAGGAAVMPPPVQFSVASYFPAPAAPLPNNPPPVHFPQTTDNSNAVPRYYPAPAPAPAPPLPNSLPPVQFSRTADISNAVPSYYHAPAPPLPNSPPPYIPPPPSGTYNHTPAGANDYPPPGVFDHNLVPLPSANATAAGFVSPGSHIPDSRYVPHIPASAVSTQQVDCYVNSTTFYEGHGGAQPDDYVSQDYKSLVDSAHYPSSSFISPNGGNADMPAGATEGWLEDPATHFDSFGNGIIGDHDQQAARTLNDVLLQMAGDDYLWEQFQCW